jgi:diadenosine tetraphosphate (Ap4A) HIT family hydrolase
MATIFTRIINGEIPGRFVYRDDRVVAFLTIAPLKPGHTLVVPIQEVEHWIDLPADLAQHLFAVAQKIGAAINDEYRPAKVGMIIAGLEVPHVHIHLVPTWEIGDLNFAHQDCNPAPELMDEAMRKLRGAIGWAPRH